MSSPFDKISQGVEKFSDFDARGVGMTATRDGVTYKMLEVPTPAWIPDSFLRSLKRNLYYNMVNSGSFRGFKSIEQSNGGKCLNFYKESNSGLISNMVSTAVKSIVSTAANQVMSVASKVDSVVNGVSSLFGSSDGGNKSLLRAIRETANEPFLAAQPYLRIDGIHLAEDVKDNWTVIAAALKGIGSAWQSIINGNSMKDVLEKWNKEIINTLKGWQILPKDVNGDLLEVLSKTLTQPEYRMHNFSEAQMLHSVQGVYTLTCKLPLFGNNVGMLNSNTGQFETGWGTAGANVPGGGTDINAILGYFQNNQFHAVWNNPITWNPSSVGRDGGRAVYYAFNIYNDTLEHVLTNLAFIWSFGATTMPVTDYLLLRPPYLYDIEVPGGFRYKYCKCGFRVTPQGRMRRLTSIQQNGVYGNGDEICNLFKSIYGITVNPTAISHVPDYYKVEIEFTPLVPNLWNFIDSYLHDGASDPKVGNTLRGMVAHAVANFNPSA